MTNKYEELARQAVAVLADFDRIEGELKFKASRLIRGYAAHIEAPADRVSFVETDASGQVLGKSVPLSQEAPLVQRPGGQWWVGMQIVYRHPQHPMMFMTEMIPLGFSALDTAVATFKVALPDGRAFDIRDEQDVPVLFEHIRLGTETRLRDLLTIGKRSIGFVA